MLNCIIKHGRRTKAGGLLLVAKGPCWHRTEKMKPYWDSFPLPNGDRIKPQKLSNWRFINRELVLYQNRVHQTCSADSWKMTSPNTTTQENWVSRTLTSSFSIYSPFWVNVQWPSMAYIVPCICIRELLGHCSKLVDWPMIWYQAQQEFQAHGFVSNYHAPQIHCFIILCSSLK